MPLALDQIGNLLAEPSRTLSDVAMVKAERRLRDFITMMWTVLEPGRRFVPGRALDAICDHLEGVTAGHISRLIMNVPPGCMKSLTTGVFWPAWEWGPRNLPHHRYICTSYHQGLTIRDNRRCRNLILSPEYQAAWGDRFAFIDDQNTKVKFENNRTGWKEASATGAVTGNRGNRFVIDDPHSVQSAESETERESTLFWFAEVVPSRLNDPETDPIIIIMQRVHANDVSGFAIERELGYTVLCLPMEFEPDHPQRWPGDWRTTPGELLWPDRFSASAVEKLKQQLRAWGGTYAEAGQLQQRPTARGGGMFKRDWFRIIASAPDAYQRVRAWDLAGSERKKSPYTVGLLLSRQGDGYVIEDVVREQLSPHGVEELILATARMDGPGTIIDIPQDPGQAGKAQVHALARLLDGFEVYWSPESGDKETRARPIAAQAEVGNVSCVAGPWVAAFLSEVAAFPRGMFKDQVDALSRAHARHLALGSGTPLVGAAPVRIT